MDAGTKEGQEIEICFGVSKKFMFMRGYTSWLLIKESEND